MCVCVCVCVCELANQQSRVIKMEDGQCLVEGGKQERMCVATNGLPPLPRQAAIAVTTGSGCINPPYLSLQSDLL